MRRFLSRGVKLLSSAPSLIVPVIIFLLLEQTLSRSQFHFHLNDRVLPQIIAVLTNPYVIGFAAIAFIVKLISVYYSNADMYLAAVGRKHRFREIRQIATIPLVSGLLFAGFCWTSAFCLLGIAVVALGEQISPGIVTLLIAAVIGACLFPLYYGVLSVGSLALIIARLEKENPTTFLLRAVRAGWRIYYYFAIRSIAETCVFVGLPITLALTLHNQIVGVLITIIVAGTFLAFSRGTFVLFKTEILLGRPLNGDSPSGAGT